MLSFDAKEHGIWWFSCVFILLIEVTRGIAEILGLSKCRIFTSTNTLLQHTTQKIIFCAVIHACYKIFLLFDFFVGTVSHSVSRTVLLSPCEAYKHWAFDYRRSIFNPLLYRLSYQAKRWNYK